MRHEARKANSRRSSRPGAGGSRRRSRRDLRDGPLRDTDFRAAHHPVRRTGRVVDIAWGRSPGGTL